MTRPAIAARLLRAGPMALVRRAELLAARARQRGQILILFVLSIFVLTGITAVVVDVSWYWANTLRVQRAADAAALAGAVKLPGDVLGSSGAYALAVAEAKKNGYTDGQTATVEPQVDPHNDRRLWVTVSAPVQTFFMRIFGITSITATRLAKAEFTLPVPMGSPQNYYGLGLLRYSGTNTGWTSAGSQPSGTWTNPSGADGSNNNSWATTGTTGARQQWGDFGLAVPAGAHISGIQVQSYALLQGSATPTTSCQLQVQLSWDGGTSWSPDPPTAAATMTLPTTEALLNVGSATDLNAWTGHAWTAADLSNANFRLRLTFTRPNCSNTRTAAVDTIQVRVTYAAQVTAPDGTTLAPQNFWGAMQSQGAPNIQGDAFMTKYQRRSPSLSANGLDANQDPDAYYDPVTYYNYGIDVPAGASNGEVWIFDPGFCEVSTSLGTGENWTVGSPNGNSTAQPVSAFYDLVNTNDTPYDLGDDTPVATSANTFRRLNGDDSAMGGSHGSTDCSGLSWHNGWWRLASGLTGGPSGTTYRLHTYSTDPNSATDQDNTTALNAFAIWAGATGGTPRVYGIGAMEGYFALPGNSSSVFYLAQIDAVHAGKTMVIDLWDPGDTGTLTANLEILQPTASGYAPFQNFTYHASLGTNDPNAANCSSSKLTASSITTSTGSGGLFNGCWVEIEIPLPATYSAPFAGEAEGGWWKIRYNMSGGSGNSTDLTTWKVSIRGNPVHLVVP